MRTKSWPLFETWKSIFGNDRAGGGGAEQLDAAAARVRAQLAGGSQSNDNSNYYYPTFEDFSPDESVPLTDVPDVNETISGSSTKEASTKTTSINKPSRFRSKTDHVDNAMMEFLTNLHNETNARLEVISMRIGYEFDMGKARQDVYDKLGSVEGLTIAQRYQLCNILGDKPQRLEVFMGMPESARLGYVLMLIDDHRRGIWRDELVVGMVVFLAALCMFKLVLYCPTIQSFVFWLVIRVVVTWSNSIALFEAAMLNFIVDVAPCLR